MGLLDLFTDANEKKAADVVDKGYRRGYKKAKKELGKGFRGLKKDYAKALNQIRKGEATATGAITTGRDAGLAEFDPYVKATSGAPQLYSDALGLGGAEGNARAVGAFQVSPGYDFAMDQGLTGIDRRAASRGMLGSGNTSIDTLNFAQGLANQEYGTWLDRLRGQQEFGAGIAGSRAGIHTGAGGQLADIATGAATKRAAIKTGLGDVKMGYGEKLADLGYATRLGRAGVQADYLAGKDQSGANTMGIVGGGASLSAKLLGGAL